MIKQGLTPRWSDHRDFDYLKSHALGGISAPEIYKEFNVNSFPSVNQNSIGLPEGCTGMSQAKLCSNEDKIMYNPAYIYIHTPPHDNISGRDIRASLSFICNNDLENMGDIVVPNSKRTGYFSIRAQNALTWFDAIYVALISTITENRSASIGVPWFPEWETLNTDHTMPFPTDFNTARATWHNAVVVGLKLINGQPHLIIDSHQGTEYGDNGMCYMSKPLANAIFNINMTEAFTVSKVIPGQLSTIDMTWVEYLVSFIRNLFHL